MIIIRTESEADFKQVYDLNFLAFGNREDESQLVERIRSSDEFVPALSIVAEMDNEIVGHILLSKAMIEDDERMHEVIVLAPIAVRPNYQKQGIGSKLIHEGLKRCNNRGFNKVMLIGHPAYYTKFGFMPARSFGLELKQFEVSDEVFMVCELVEGELTNIKGELKYPNSFFG